MSLSHWGMFPIAMAIIYVADSESYDAKYLHG
jgi:hypothetical protein